MEKIVTRLIGGLGNQFFQYAVAKTICNRHGQKLLLDLEAFKDYKIRNYELSNFNVTEDIVSDKDRASLRKKRLFNKTRFKEKTSDFKFNPKILDIKKSAYLEGFWQSEKYFKEIEDEIRHDFTFKNFDFIKNQQILDKIKNSNAVSINFRLREYISDPKVRSIHYVCTKKYYDGAINYIMNNVENPKFFIFSDEIDKVNDHFSLPIEYESVNTSNWQEDLYFMQNCKHNIIANSSFSWLAAWLNQNPQKIVAAPEEWFTKSSKICYKDVVPHNWIKIPV